MTRYVSIEQAAEALGVSARTVRRRISDGTLEARRVGPRLIRVPEHALTAAGRPLTIGAAQR
ncbi:helix-turn-helix domain-containing protein [Microbacterium lacticum]|uniref:helix-turn-helix domain-containing protein n=1 Tax=Microbacterium lacticum TaxID=33885 RepID=UPI0028D78351|nr:helix-turn-helix domain-containing protein [Microbacterium lacticum]